MPARPEKRHIVDFNVFLAWQAGNGNVHRVQGRCVDLSSSGAKLETRDRLEPRANVLVESQQFGRMGMASIRYCSRVAMKYEVGLQFIAPLILSTPARKTILDKVVRRDTEAGSS